MLSVLSFGAGQDSTALLFKYIYDKEFREKYAPNDFAVVFSDTGDEHPHTYAYLEYIQEICNNNNIEFYWLKPEMGYHANSWQSLFGKFYRNDTIMGKGMTQSCTDGLKIQPIYNWLADYVNKKYMHSLSRAYGKVSLKEYVIRYGQKINMLVGIAYGEDHRLDPDWKDKESKLYMKMAIEKVHPLVDLKMDRKACQEYIKLTGHKVPYPSNCLRCFWMSKIELLWLYRNYPDQYNEWVDREKAKVDRCAPRLKEGEIKSNDGVFGKKLLPQILEEAIKKYGDWTDEQLNEYKFSHGHCVKSKY